MIKTINQESQLWQSINKNYLNKKNLNNLKDFKSSMINFKISIWNPQTNGVRYLKTLIYNLCTLLTNTQWQKIKKIKNRNFGNPINIIFNKEKICLDYLQALYELEFIEKKLSLNKKRVIEIGAGYGRTCHAITSNSEVKEYYLVDLNNSLELSKKYLYMVLKPKDFKKIKFIIAENLHLLKDKIFDLAINIDSFAEMDGSIVKNYLNFINTNCHWAYIKNPVGKYFDKSLDNHSQGKEVVKAALSTGILKDIIDIHNNNEILFQIPKFIKAYMPGDRWFCVKDSWAKPWSYYWQALYQKG